MAYPANAVAGQIWFQGLIDGGPSIGLVRRPLFNDRVVTAAGVTAIEPYDFLVLLNAAALQTIQLPDVVLWMRQPYGQFPLLIKDRGMNASAFNKTVLPFGAQTIDGLPNLKIISDGGFAYLRPYSDLSGWMTAA